MNRLLNKQEIHYGVSRAEFLMDIHCLFETLKTSYGMYEYFGHDAFTAAKAVITSWLNNREFDINTALTLVQKTFASFIRDGHFRFGPSEPAAADPGFAVCYSTLHGIPVIRCRKFWFDTPEEERELLQFSESYPLYRNDDPLILDLRDNPGGSDVYIWNFIKGLYGAEPDYPCTFLQKYSELFGAATGTSKRGIETWHSDGVTIRSKKPVYVWVNEHTASSAESAVAYFRTAENVTIVGTHTAGCFACGNCMTIYLPNTHLPVYFGTGMVLYEKNRNIDAEGGFRADLPDEVFLKMITKT